MGKRRLEIEIFTDEMIQQAEEMQQFLLTQIVPGNGLPKGKPKKTEMVVFSNGDGSLNVLSQEDYEQMIQQMIQYSIYTTSSCCSQQFVGVNLLGEHDTFSANVGCDDNGNQMIQLADGNWYGYQVDEQGLHDVEAVSVVYCSAGQVLQTGEVPPVKYVPISQALHFPLFKL